jgi:acyl-CoA thioester hydrolase
MTGPVLWRERITVRFSDCDPLGHVNNAVYLTYIEHARLNMWRAQFGFSSKPPAPGQRRPQGFILARAEVDFRSQAYDSDVLEVRIGLAGFGRSSATYEYEIVHVPSERLIASAKTVQVWFDYETNSSVVISEELKKRLTTVPG